MISTEKLMFQYRSILKGNNNCNKLSEQICIVMEMLNNYFSIYDICHKTNYHIIFRKLYILNDSADLIGISIFENITMEILLTYRMKFIKIFQKIFFLILDNPELFMKEYTAEYSYAM